MMSICIQVTEVFSREELYKKAESDWATRCGATNDPQQRKYGYSSPSTGISGTMYCLKVENQYKEENELLKFKDWEKNKHKISNVHGEPGYVYVIDEDK
jgi:hypothetical protein